MFRIELKHGEFTWVVKRKEKHFMELHRELRTYKTFMRIPLPSRRLVLTQPANRPALPPFCFHIAPSADHKANKSRLFNLHQAF